MLSTTLAFGAVMGEEAIEMAGVISHPQVRECMKTIDIGQMVNVQIEKKVARCPMCNSYVITGNMIEGGDIIVPEITEIKIIGKGVTGFGEGFSQTYNCEVTTK